MNLGFSLFIYPFYCDLDTRLKLHQFIFYCGIGPQPMPRAARTITKPKLKPHGKDTKAEFLLITSTNLQSVRVAPGIRSLSSVVPRGIFLCRDVDVLHLAASRHLTAGISSTQRGPFLTPLTDTTHETRETRH